MPGAIQPGRRIAFSVLPSVAMLLWAFGSAQTRPVEPSGFSLKGSMLVAMSRMPDPRFTKSVILILDHGESGALGLIVNRPLSEVALADLLSELETETPAADRPVRLHFGGPVQMNRLFLLHSSDFSSESSEAVAPGVSLTLDPEALGRIGKGEGPAKYLLVAGYAGWAPGQLEAEMQQGSWMDVKMLPEWVFADDPSKTWQTIFDKYVTRF